MHASDHLFDINDKNVCGRVATIFESNIKEEGKKTTKDNKIQRRRKKNNKRRSIIGKTIHLQNNLCVSVAVNITV